MRSGADRSRLEKLGVVVLEYDTAHGIVLVDADQLADLARLGFQPRQTDDLELLLAAQGAGANWLASGLAPQMANSRTVQHFQSETASDQTDALAAARADLRASLHSLPSEERSALALLPAVDDNSDGLSNTEEGWWCTDPNDADSDDDLVNDGQEVSQLLTGNRTNGKPFLGWPAGIPGCYDDDQDSVPDAAETNVVGLSINRESSDLDKYDDGQEFFGSTYCPGGPGSCNYGALPRTEDLYLGSNMPSFVKIPANSPFVAAFPDPSVSVVDGSLNVQAVTTITTDHTIGSGESHTYSTATTRGTSTSNVDLETWNDWQEVKDNTGNVHQILLAPRFARSGRSPDESNWLQVLGTGAIAIGAGVALFACGATIVCAGAALVFYGSTLLFVDSIVEDSSNLEAFDPASSDADDLPSLNCEVSGCDVGTVRGSDEQDVLDRNDALSETQDRSSSVGGAHYSHDDSGNLAVKQTHPQEIPLDEQLSNLAAVNSCDGNRWHQRNHHHRIL